MITSDILISFIITYIIGLLPPLFIRYLILNKPIKRHTATGVVIMFGIINFGIFTLLKGSAATSLPVFLISVISFYILISEKSLNLQPKTVQKDSSKNLRRIYNITGNVSITLSIVGLISGIKVGYTPEHLITDLIVSIFWNFPRFYFGLLLRRQNSTTAEKAIKISFWMLIYSIIVALGNLLPLFFGNYNSLMTGWIYYILIYLYYLSFRKSKEFIYTEKRKELKTLKTIMPSKSKITINNFLIVFIIFAIITFLTILVIGKNNIELPSSTQNTSLYTEYKKTKNTCVFELSEIHEFKEGGNPKKIDELKSKSTSDNSFENKYLDSNTWLDQREVWEQENFRWFYYEGLIRNKSDKEQRLKNINAKLRTTTNIFIKEGWSEQLEYTLAPGEALPFKVTIKVDSEDLVKKYIENANYTLKTSFYPWFETCSY